MTNVFDASEAANEAAAQHKASAVPPATAAKKSKPRKRVNTAEKRHQHNAIERQRRETLNGKFIHLARLLPSLAAHRRPSKSAIVNGSINHLNHQRNQRLLAAKLLRKLCAEHDALLTEVNEWRKANGFAPKEPTSAWTDEVDEILSVEKESFGNFSTFDGDEGEEDENDAPESVVSHPNYMLSSGLITPRPSTDSAGSYTHEHDLFANIPVAEQRPVLPEQRPAHATASGVTWSNEFALSMGGNNSLGFQSFLSRGNEQSPPAGSPENSQYSTGVTPPTYTEILKANRISSPGSSSGSNGEEQPAWVSMLSGAQLSNQRQAASFAGNFATENVGSSDSFTQQLMASMLGGNVSQEQVEQWRRSALGSVVPEEVRPQSAHPTSVHDLRHAVRLGMGVGLRMQGNGWPQTRVEGFSV